ncbi:MAG: hypothetical protein ACYTHM_09350 [Planctomycetota bacterium]
MMNPLTRRRKYERPWACAQRNLPLMFFSVAVLFCVHSCNGAGDDRSQEGENMNPLQGSIEKLAARLKSTDPMERYRATGWLRTFAGAANETVLPALADKAEIVSKAAQAHFIAQGETVVPYLVEKLIEVGEDTGLYARIAGGKEREHGKSLAGTLWLTLVRGVERDAALVRVADLLRHESPRVRAVALFTAVSTRDPRFSALLQGIAADEHTLVKARLRESLVQLFFGSSSSTPGMDKEAKEKALPLLRRELAPILNDNAPGFIEIKETLPELLGVRPLKQCREEIASMVREALEGDRLTPDGAINAGKILAVQLKEEPLKAAFDAWAKEVFQAPPGASNARKLAALSCFPVEVFDAALTDAVTELAGKSPPEGSPPRRGLPAFALKTFEKALLDEDLASARRVIDILPAWLSRAEDESFLEIAFACKDALQSIERKRQQVIAAGKGEGLKPFEAVCEKLKESVRGAADRLFALSKSLPARQLLDAELFFLAIDDGRAVDIFKAAWEHRFDEDVEIAWILGDCLRPLARRKEKGILPLLLEYAESGSGVKHTHLKDACIYSLTLGRYSAILDTYLTDERFERWMVILKDLEEHPRFRAGFFPLLEVEALGKDRKKSLSDIAIGYTSPPHDSNLRSKAALHALLSGDRRGIGPIHRLAEERDHPWWVFHNAYSGIAALHGARGKRKEGESFAVPVKAARILLDMMEGGLKSMESFPKAQIVHVNNYYNWGIQYMIFPPEMCARVLKEITKAEGDFGTDVAKWRAWLEEIEKTE